MAEITRGDRNIEWIEAYCRIPEGKFVGQPVRLSPFQKRVIKGIYDDPTRRVIISFGRKNAKTTLSAFLCLLHTCGPEARPNSQLYSAAQSRDQAAILFNLMSKMVMMSPDLSEYVGIRESAKQIYCNELGTVYRALSAEASTAYGLSPVFVVHDELGQVVGPRSGMYSALETACAAQEEPLSIIISTQAPTDADLLSVLIDDALAGHDPETKVFLYSASDDLDPFSDEAIRAANPAFDEFMNQKEVRDQAAVAKRMPSQESSYRNLVLNQRVAREAPFVSQSIWNKNNAEPREEDFEGEVVLGLDLSSKRDLTALVAVAVGGDGEKSVKCEFFLPAEGIQDKSREDRITYDVWADQGFLTLCPGSKVDYAMLAERLVYWCENYNVAKIDFDAWKIEELRTELRHMGYDDLPFCEFRQGFKSMSPAIDYLEGELFDGKIRHGGNPVLTWNASNSVIDTDPTLGRKFNKKRSTGRIDGMVALVMATFGAKVFEPSGDVMAMVI